METDCIIALIAGIMVLVSGSVIGFYSWDKAYGGRNVITGIGVMVLGAVLIVQTILQKSERLVSQK